MSILDIYITTTTHVLWEKHPSGSNERVCILSEHGLLILSLLFLPTLFSHLLIFLLGGVQEYEFCWEKVFLKGVIARRP